MFERRSIIIQFVLKKLATSLIKRYNLVCQQINGGLAQLGERLAGSQKVSGSIPLVSTINNSQKPFIYKGFLFFLILSCAV
jgi:hypothetical protein